MVPAQASTAPTAIRKMLTAIAIFGIHPSEVSLTSDRGVPTAGHATRARSVRIPPRARSAPSFRALVESVAYNALSKLVFHNLAGGVDRKLVDDLDLARDLVVGHLVSAPGEDFFPAGGGGDDESHADLAHAVVGDADDRRLLDVRMAQESVLDLGRVNVEAADDEHVLDATDDAEVAALVEHAEVAGARPAVVGQRVGRGLRVVEVAGHHRPALDDDLARLSRRSIDAELEPGTGAAHGGGDGLEVVVR